MFGMNMMGDLEDDPIFGHHMRSMRQMNTMMSSMFPDPFGGMFNHFDPSSALMGGHSALTGAMSHHQPHMHHHQHQHQLMPMLQQHQQMHQRGAGMLMPFGFGMGGPGGLANMNPLLVGHSHSDGGGASSFSSSQVISMTRGPDGRPQVYKATSSTKTGPGGIKETQKTVQDSRSGVKKMAIGHHIGERAHVIEREKNYNTGHEEERQDFINLEEEEAEEFNREFTQRSRSLGGRSHGAGRDSGAVAAIMPSSSSARGSPAPLAIMPSSQNQSRSTPPPPSVIVQDITKSEAQLTSKPPTGKVRRTTSKLARRPIRSSDGESANTESPSIHPHPYGGPGGATSGAARRRVKGNSPSHHQQQTHVNQHSVHQPHRQPPQMQSYQTVAQRQPTNPRNGGPWNEDAL